MTTHGAARQAATDPTAKVSDTIFPAPVTLDGGRVVVNPAYVDLLKAHGLTTFEAVMAYTAGGADGVHLVRTRRERSNVRFVLADAAGRPTALYAKRHHPPGWGEQVWRVLTGRGAASFGRREWAAYALVRAAGIATPERVATGERRIGPVGRESFFICAELTGWRPADQVLSEMAPADRAPLLDAIARLARRFHDAGLNHRDLYLCHVFVPEAKPEHISLSHDPQSAEGGRRGAGDTAEQGLQRPYRPGHTENGRQFDLALIDLQRVERRRFARRRWLVKDIAQLAYSARGMVSEADWQRFLEVYFDVPALSGAQRRFAAAVRRKVGRIARHDRRRRDGIESQRPVCVQRTGRRGGP